ncbi:MAG: chemotaxis response regulator protein-glutamate methylesterase [Phycisphaeraceae bacterium]|nr:MAG: chemotaxis response regulator protein-glutamate methylesterase [Phycisphaeraceae bacterium]
MLRVLVVDDSAFMRKALVRMIESDSDLKVIGQGRNGEDAVKLAAELKPDVITMDIEMPVMDGLTALTRIMAETPTPVLMCSSLTTQGSRDALKALRLGALDFIAKDASYVSIHIDAIRDDLIGKIKAVGRQKLKPTPKGPAFEAPEKTIAGFAPDQFELILIGSSTGGPPVLEHILSNLPPDMAAPIVVAQHMPNIFTKSMSERLDSLCAVTVVHGEHGMPLYPGTVYIGQGGKHVHVARTPGGRWSLQIDDEPAGALYKPSVDELFRSGARTAGARCLAIVLTGMGADGLLGARELKAKGGIVLAQDEATSVVYGMPRAVAREGLADASLPPTGIITHLTALRGAPASGAPMRTSA